MLSPSMQQRLLINLERCLKLLVAALSLGLILLFLFTALHRMRYPYLLEQIEANMLVSVWRVLHGLPIYTQPSVDFVPYLYTPLYYYLAAGLAHVTGFSYLPLRLLSILSTLGCLGVIYAFVYGETRKHLPSLAAAGFFAACYHPVQGWFDLGRVDSLYVFFFLLAIYCTRRAPIVLAALVWVIAFQTKQGVLPVALLIFCSEWQRPKRMLLGMGTLIAGIGGSILLLNHATGGWYNYYVFATTGGLGWIWRQFVFYVPVDLLLPFGLACLILLAALLYTPPSVTGRGTQFFALVSFAVYASIWYLRSHSGSTQNTLIPAYAWTAILFGMALGRLAGKLQQSGAAGNGNQKLILRILLFAAVSMQLVAHIYQPGVFVPSAAVRADHQALIDQIRSIPGEVYIVRHNDDELLAGKPGFAAIDAFGLITQSPKTKGSLALNRNIEQAVDSHRFSAVIVDNEQGPTWLYDAGLPKDFLQQYPIRVAARGNTATDPTTNHPHEVWIYLPCSAAAGLAESLAPQGSEIGYGSCAHPGT